MSLALKGGRLTEEPQVAFLRTTDPTADRQGENLDQVQRDEITAEGVSQGAGRGASRRRQPSRKGRDLKAQRKANS
jgi:hypothetical protein